MVIQTFQKICPLCKTSNEPNVVICRHCGAHIELLPNMPTIRFDKNSADLTEDARKKIERFAPPAEGISFYLLNGEKPIAQRTEREFVLGRASDTNSGPLVDLTEFDGSGQGVSRRHAMVRAVEKKYVLVDLNSSNGTWLNGQRLVPTKPYDVHNGAVIQLGRMKLLVSYTRPKA